MSAEQSDGRHERATDSQIARRVLWVLPVLLGIIGFFSNRSLSNIEQGQLDSAKAQAETNKQVAQLSTDVRVMNARVEYSLIQQLEDTRKRVERLEQTVKTP
jgi:hypothetical protein